MALVCFRLVLVALNLWTVVGTAITATAPAHGSFTALARCLVLTLLLVATTTAAVFSVATTASSTSSTERLLAISSLGRLLLISFSGISSATSTAVSATSAAAACLTISFTLSSLLLVSLIHFSILALFILGCISTVAFLTIASTTRTATPSGSSAVSSSSSASFFAALSPIYTIREALAAFLFLSGSLALLLLLGTFLLLAAGSTLTLLTWRSLLSITIISFLFTGAVLVLDVATTSTALTSSTTTLAAATSFTALLLAHIKLLLTGKLVLLLTILFLFLFLGRGIVFFLLTIPAAWRHRTYRNHLIVILNLGFKLRDLCFISELGLLTLAKAEAHLLRLFNRRLTMLAIFTFVTLLLALNPIVFALLPLLFFDDLLFGLGRVLSVAASISTTSAAACTTRVLLVEGSELSLNSLLLCSKGLKDFRVHLKIDFHLLLDWEVVGLCLTLGLVGIFGVIPVLRQLFVVGAEETEAVNRVFALRNVEHVTNPVSIAVFITQDAVTYLLRIILAKLGHDSAVQVADVRRAVLAFLLVSTTILVHALEEQMNFEFEWWLLFTHYINVELVAVLEEAESRVTAISGTTIAAILTIATGTVVAAAATTIFAEPTATSASTALISTIETLVTILVLIAT